MLLESIASFSKRYTVLSGEYSTYSLVLSGEYLCFQTL